MSREDATPYDYDAIGPGYYDHVFQRGAGIQSKWHHLKFSHVRRHLPARTRDLLDIGCGPGTFIGSLPQEVRCVGIDVARAQIDYAVRQYGTNSHTFQCVGNGVLPFDHASFDAVTLVELIEHLDRPRIESLLYEAIRVLRPGGRLIVTTPNYASLWPLLEKAVNARTPVSYEYQHISFFTRRRLRDLLIGIGLSSVDVTTFMGASPFFAAVNWKLADRVQIIENPLLAHGLGFLLLGSASKA